MLVSPFRVRLADTESDIGYRTGYIGTVIGEDMIQTEAGTKKVYLVLWYEVDEETGDETISAQPAPSSHLANELRAHTDPDTWETTEDWDDIEEEDGLEASDDTTEGEAEHVSQ